MEFVNSDKEEEIRANGVCKPLVNKKATHPQTCRTQARSRKFPSYFSVFSASEKSSLPNTGSVSYRLI